MLAGQDLMVLLAIAFFIFGAKKLPEIGSGLGKAMRSFKDGIDGVESKTPAPPEKPNVLVERASAGPERIDPKGEYKTNV